MDSSHSAAIAPPEAHPSTDSYRPHRYAALLAITVTGFTSALAQIVTVRELLVLFYGNELSSGLVFASWLLWTALGSGLGGRYGRRVNPTGLSLARVLLLLALILPATLLWIRATRMVWSIPVGELLPLGKMLAIALTTTGPLCTTSGFVFALAWAVQAATVGAPPTREARANPESSRAAPNLHELTPSVEDKIPPTPSHPAQPLLVYLGEAAGAALGGLSLYFVLLPHVSVLTAVLANALMLWAAAAVLVRWSWSKTCRRLNILLTTGLWLVIGLILATALIRVDTVDGHSRRWQWGSDLLAVYDTPYHHLALVQQPNQMSVFANGLWWFSTPDPQTAEYAVHVALLEHPNPRKILLVGSGIAGMVDEILKHPVVESVDYVEADPEVIPLIAAHLSSAATASLRDPRVHLFHLDAGSFIREHRQRYDVVLLNSGDPMNLQVNRFYTVEFYRRIAKILEPGGMVSFAVGTSADIVGPVQARFLRSLYASLQAVFPDVMVFPGDNARFLAANVSHRLSTDPRQLAERLRERGLKLQYVRVDSLDDALNPFRLQALTAILEPSPAPGAPRAKVVTNRDFVPICYFHNLLVWAAQLHGGILQGLLTLARNKTGWLWAGGVVLVLAVLLLLGPGRSRPGAAVGFNVLVVGGALMSMEIVLLLAFQVFAGFVYRQVALIIALFMVGMALGAALLSKLGDRPMRARFWLMACQGMLCLFLVALAFLFQVLQHWLDASARGSTDLSLTVVFAVLALIFGFLGGIHFSLAVRVLAGATVASEKIGGGLYGLDLLGAAGGALIASLFLIPLYGILTTIDVFAAFTGIGALALVPGKRTSGVQL